MHKERSIQKWFVEIGVEELDWAADSSDLNLIEHLWGELERRLRATYIYTHMYIQYQSKV